MWGRVPVLQAESFLLLRGWRTPSPAGVPCSTTSTTALIFLICITCTDITQFVINSVYYTARLLTIYQRPCNLTDLYENNYDARQSPHLLFTP